MRATKMISNGQDVLNYCQIKSGQAISLERVSYEGAFDR